MNPPHDIGHARAEFPILETTVHGKPLVYLDTAASAQKPRGVLDAMDRFARSQYANVKRSAHFLAERSTSAYENARITVAQSLGVDAHEIIFTSGTTDALNKAARMIEPTIKHDDEILVSVMEHHSNLVPWQQIAQRRGASFKAIPITAEYRLDMDALERLLSRRTKIVAVTHVSNVLGTTNPIKAIAALVRKHAPAAILVVDGAQAVPHLALDLRDLGADMYAFSGHKMYGPTGIGVLYGKADLLRRFEPPAWGGEMVDRVTMERTTWADIPAKYEPGTPNIIGAIGLGAAVRFINGIGIPAIKAHEHALIETALERLSRIEGLRIIGPIDAHQRGGAISFTLDGWHPHDLAAVLDQDGIAVRAGHHCAQPLHNALGIDASVRASFGVYSTREDIDALVRAIARAASKEAIDPSSVFDGDLTPEQELIKQDIMDHAIHPRNRREIPGVTPVLGKNTSCGDIVAVYLAVDGGKIADLAFQGKGCAISQAAMSKLTKDLKGKDAKEALGLGLDHVSRLLGLDFSDKPVRAKCAALGLRATQAAIRQAQED